MTVVRESVDFFRSCAAIVRVRARSGGTGGSFFNPVYRRGERGVCSTRVHAAATLR